MDQNIWPDSVLGSLSPEFFCYFFPSQKIILDLVAYFALILLFSNNRAAEFQTFSYTQLEYLFLENYF